MPELYDPVLRGFGDLSSALLLGPQIARKNRLEEQRMQMHDQERQDALAQALQIANENRAAREQQQQDLFDYRQQTLAQTKARDDNTAANQKADNTRQAMEGFGNGLYKAGKLIAPFLGGGTSKTPRPLKKNLINPKDGSPPYLVDEDGNVTEVTPPKPQAQAKAEAEDAQNTHNALTKELTGYVDPTQPNPLGRFVAGARLNNVPGAMDWNESQDYSLAHPYKNPKNPNQFVDIPRNPDGSPLGAALNVQPKVQGKPQAKPVTSVKITDPSELAKVNALDPDARNAYLKVLSQGDPVSIAEAKAILFKLP